MHIHGAGFAFKVRAPDEAHNGLPGQDHLRIDHQIPQELIFLVGQLHAFALGQYDPAGVVQLDVPHPELLGGLLRGAAQQGLHPGQQLQHGEGFFDIVVGPVVQSLHHVHFRGFGGDHDHGQPLGGGLAAQLPHNIAAVFVRQHYIHQHQVRQNVVQSPVKVCGPGEGLYQIIAVFQGDGLDFPDVVIVLYYIDQCHSVFLSFVRAAGIPSASCRIPAGTRGRCPWWSDSDIRGCRIHWHVPRSGRRPHWSSGPIPARSR